MTATTTPWTALLAELFDDPLVGRCLVAPDGTILRANPEWLRAAGLTLEEVVGEDVVRLFPDTRDMALAMHARARAGHRVDVPRHAQRVRGREIWWEGTIAPIPMEGGTGLLLTMREAPAPPPAGADPAGSPALAPAALVAALHAEKEKYRSLFEHSLDAVYLATRDGEILDANQAACQLHGMTVEEIRRAGRAALVVQDDRHAAALDARAAAGHVRAEMTARRKDGTTVPVEVESVLLDPARPDSHAFVISRDVSDRVRRVEALRAALEELRESEDRFRAVYESANDAVLLTDPRGDGRVLMANPAACRMFGYTEEELRALDRPKLLDLADPKLSAFLAARRQDRQTGPAELTYLRKDGSRFTGEITSAVFQDRAGETRSVAIVRDVSERKRAAEALALSEAVLAQAGAMARLGAWWIEVSNEADLDANPLRWSAETYRIFGYEPGEVAVSNELFFRHVHPDDRRRVVEAVARSIEARERYAVEHRIVRRDGEERVVLEHGEAHRDDAGRLVRLVGAVQDITDRKRAEEALRRAERHYRTLAENSPEVIARFDRQLRHTFVNEYGAKVYGVPVAEVIGRTSAELGMPPDNVAFWARHFDEVFATGEQRTVDFDFASPTFGNQSFSSLFVPERDEAGTVTSVLAITRDVTAQRRAEEELRESEEKFRSVLENMSEGLMLFDAQGNLVYQNPASLRIHGFDPGADGRIPHDELPATWRAWDATGRAIAFDEWPVSRVFRNERFQDQVLHVERVETGRVFDGSHNGSPIRDAQGRIAYGFITIRDITEQVRAKAHQDRAEAALREANGRLQEADRRKDEFLGMLSHELRNPLAPIRNALYILDRAEPSGQQARSAKDVASRQVAHLTRLVDDLLDVTRIARGKIELRRADLDLSALARRTADDYRALMQQRGLELAVELPDRPIVVNGDDTRLAQVLGNLLSNAAKFTPPGGRVTLSLGVQHGSALVRVRDTGPGIPPEVLPTIFEPFTQAKQTLARSEGGLGLGLALVKGLVALHGGEVTVSGAGVAGSEFVVTLPLARDEGAEDRGRSPPDAPAGAPRRRVLVVDDNADAADTLAQLVEMLGHEVEVAYDGAGALAAVRARAPDVVLCDLGLPGIDGYEVARQLRAELPRRLRLVAVSGYAQPEDVSRAVEAGFDAHVAKPPDPAKLEQILGERLP